MIEIVPEYTDIQKTSLDETGWTGFNTPHSSNVGQTYGPAGMGIGAYMDRPETKPGFVPFKRSNLGYESNVGTSMQTDGPAGMGMNAYVNRPGPRYKTVGDQMRGEGFLETMSGKKIFPTQLNDWGMKNISYGLPATNQGYKVWNASGLTDWLNYLKRFTPWYDPEQDVWRHEQYQEQNPDLDEQTQEDIDEGKEKARAEWFAEYGTEGTGEYYPDKILRDAFPQSYPYLGDFPTGEAITPDVMDEPTKEPDIGPYTLEAQSQWKRPENVRSLLDYIMEKIGGDEPAARKYIFDNFGLKLPQLSLGVNRGGIIGLI